MSILALSPQTASYASILPSHSKGCQCASCCLLSGTNVNSQDDTQDNNSQQTQFSQAAQIIPELATFDLEQIQASKKNQEAEENFQKLLPQDNLQTYLELRPRLTQLPFAFTLSEPYLRQTVEQLVDLNRLPINLDSHELPKLNPYDWRFVPQFSDNTTNKTIGDEIKDEIKDEQAEGIKPTKGRQILFMEDSPSSRRPTGAKIAIINETGQNITLPQVTDYLNQDINDEVMRRFWGVIAHECLHRFVIETVPYCKVSKWNEIIVITIRDFNNRASIISRGEADMKQELTGEIDKTETAIDGPSGQAWEKGISFWDRVNHQSFAEQIKNSDKYQGEFLGFVQNIQNFNSDLRSQLSQGKQQAIQFCLKVIAVIQKLITDLTFAAKKFGEYAYYSQSLIISAMAPMLLIHNYPVHAGTISAEDINVKNVFGHQLQECKHDAQESLARIEMLKSIQSEVMSIKDEIAQGQQPHMLQLPENLTTNAWKNIGDGSWGLVAIADR